MIPTAPAGNARRLRARRLVLWLGLLAGLLTIPAIAAPPGVLGRVAGPPAGTMPPVRATGTPKPARPGSAVAPQPAGLTAVYRSGQTFLTWQERTDLSGESYHVYRSSRPITAATLIAARQLTSRWGALPEGSSIFWSERSYPDSMPGGVSRVQNYVISDLGPQLADTTGLFVWTPKETGRYYYAVTTVLHGVENTTDFSADNSLPNPVEETPADPAPVRIWQSPGGYGAVYTQFLDYETYNPTLNLVAPNLSIAYAAAPHPQYAFNYSVALPTAASCGGTRPAAYPLVMVLHGYGRRYNNAVDESGSCAVYLYADEPANTWYFGHSGTWDYRQDGGPASGPIVNYSEDRLLRAIYDVERGYGSAGYPIDPARRFVMGNSMGAAGALSFGLRYGNVFAAVYAGKPMTNLRAADGTEQPPGTPWYESMIMLWGDAGQALPVQIIGRSAGLLQRYNGMSIWDWENHQQMTLMRRGDDSALLAFAHGTLDTVIHWQSQAKPFYLPLYQSRRTFSAATRTVDHETSTGSAGMGPMVSGNFNNWQVRQDESVPALGYASGSGAVPPPDGVASDYNLNLEWGASWHAFPGSAPPVDTRTEWGIDLRTTDGSTQTVDVTPRRLQHFTPAAGATYHWTVQAITGTAVLTEGLVSGDADSLITVPGVPVDGRGVHLSIRRSAPAPSPTPAPATATPPPPPTGTPGPGCAIAFTDVQPDDYFYTPVQYLFCHAWISGYADHTFRPGNPASRGQVTKIVVLAFGLPLVTPATPSFSDVAPGDVFAPYIETAAAYHLVNGYSDGTFRPYNNVSRGQFAKILVNAAGWTVISPDRPSFADVGPTNPFYSMIETAYAHGVISGYSNFTFRPFNNVTRAQIAKIIYNAQTQPLRR